VSDTPSTGWHPEEPWEQESASLLGALPTVEPPPGFLSSAVDHRPLFAGRVTGALFSASMVALTVGIVVGALEQPAVTPSVDALRARHSSMVLDLFAGRSTDEGLFSALDPQAGPPVSLPHDFESHGYVEADRLRQAVFARKDEAVSIFSEPGRVDWSGLPSGNLESISGVTAWIDPDRKVAIVQADGAAITIVGLDATEVGEVLASMPAGEDGFARRFRDATAALTTELGFPGS
jgi:hypothetical protein